MSDDHVVTVPPGWEVFQQGAAIYVQDRLMIVKRVEDGRLIVRRKWIQWRWLTPRRLSQLLFGLVDVIVIGIIAAVWCYHLGAHDDVQLWVMGFAVGLPAILLGAIAGWSYRGFQGW